MSAEMYGRAWAVPLNGAGSRLVLLYLVERANERAQCYPKIATIADATGLSARTVRRALADLEHAGLIARERRHREVDGSRTSDRITILLAATQSARRRQPKRPEWLARAARKVSPSGHSGRADPLTDPLSEPLSLLAADVPPRREEPENLHTVVADACGIDESAATASGSGALNRAVKQLRDVDATADAVRARARRYRQVFPAAALTPMALAKHWAALTPPNRPQSRHVDAEAWGFDEWRTTP